MSMPTIPDIKPKIEISLEETIRLLLASKKRLQFVSLNSDL
ncbi:MAG: hypothetical protein PWQ82_1489 [Thermosediminibacterales bacterium]|nr:hypothetical protein [Thermosediminibacterales bacterium]